MSGVKANKISPATSTVVTLGDSEAYGAIENQLDQIYHDQVDGTTVWKDHIAAVKGVHPKP
jgi:hypothetical protein